MGISAMRLNDTLYVAATSLSIALAACFFIAASVRLWCLRSKRPLIYPYVKQARKLISIVLYAALQLASLVLWAKNGGRYSQLSAVSFGLTFAAAGMMLCLSHREYTRNVRPSSVLEVYLLLQALSDITRTCTLWLASDATSLKIFMTTITANILLLFAQEAWGKSPQIFNEKQYDNRPEQMSGIANRAVFFWLNRLLLLGARGRLEYDDLFELADSMKSNNLHDAFKLEYKKRQNKASHAALVTIGVVLKWPILVTAIPRVLSLALTLCQPLLTEQLLQYLAKSDDTVPLPYGQSLIGAYALLYVGLAIFTGLYWYLHFRALTMIRGCLVSSISWKVIHLDMVQIDDPSASITLMSTDIQQITLGLTNFHELWANTIQVGIAAYLLERQIGVACVMPIGIAVLCTLASTKISAWSSLRQKKWMQAIEARIKITASLLSSAKGIKMRGLMTIFSDQIQHLRWLELQCASRFRKTIVCTLVFAYIPSLLGPAITFLVFILQSHAKGRSFDAARAFTSLTTLIILTQPLSSTLQSLPLLAAAVASFGRIDKFLASEEHVDNRVYARDTANSLGSRSLPSGSGDEDQVELQTETHPEKSPIIPHRHQIILCTSNAAIGWSAAQTPVLRNISVSIPQGLLTCVTGPVACGKTTLCRALAGELGCQSGEIQMYAPATDVAFCDQVPWLINGSIKKNIVGYSDFDARWYDTVLGACALREDLNNMSEGSDTIVGSGGAALSGGQKQRVALARAIYARKSIIILDDVLSGLDARASQQIFDQAIGPTGIARKYGATVILASHAGPHLSQADHIIAIGVHGDAATEGSYEGVIPKVLLNTPPPDLQTSGDLAISSSPAQAAKGSEALQASILKHDTDMEADRAIHAYYFKAAGLWVLLLLFVLAVAEAGFYVFPTYWLQIWTKQSNANNIRYWGVYFALQCLALIFLAAIAYHTVIILVTRTSSILHRRLIDTVARAQWHFLSSANGGTILNHFSQDLQLIDDDLPFAFLNLILTAFFAIGQSILVIASFPWSAVAFGGCIIILYALQRFYLRTSRQLRLLDLDAKSPIYSHYLETLKGLPTLRAFGWAEQAFEASQTLLDQSQQPAYLLPMVQRWLNFVLDVVVACLAVIVATVAVTQKSQQGLTGVAITQIMSIGIMMQSAVKSWTVFEISLGAIARIKTFVETTPVEHDTYLTTVPASWPDGRVELRNVTAAYNCVSSKNPSVTLRNVSLVLESGKKIGLCGKTGSGKSSLLQTILQLLHKEEGTILIDGIDLDGVHPDVIRDRINSIPQEPTALPGTVRKNLDPCNTHSDEELITAIQKVGLAHLLEGQLSLSTDFNHSMLSSGEWQLFALASAILRKSTIVLIDEATSQVDEDFERRIQEVIRNEFRSSTVITVAHRLEGLLDYDLIAVLDRGEIVELGSPQTLLSQDSQFRRMVEISKRGNQSG
ncbi:hypothetical protein JX265_010372 [Neoarthrinium moseri]|uniref:ABC transporter n=1 Tax=Neoarthrinium moseri TaxID=1658444 RepID=A0A9Q0AKN5_9PEZI|nr:hypothetical protein JX265_010372 [Neoarthrinium moseri]